MRSLLLAAALFGFTNTALAADRPVDVMILGTFHMSNPGRDMHNMHADDVLSPKRQAELQAAVDGIARFRPTMVDVEWDSADKEYRQYLSGSLKPSRNEVVQLGFRLAKQARLATVHGIDVEADFPYDAVQAYAKAHGKMGILDRANAEVAARVEATNTTLKNGTIGKTLRSLNDPAAIAGDNAFYRKMLVIGGRAAQPGADLLAAWYKRNFYICANLVQLAKPGDRVVVFYGAGHAFLLRQCIREMPGYRLIEANDYLPR